MKDKTLEGAIKRLEDNIREEEYNNWGQRADIITVIEAARGLVKPKEVLVTLPPIAPGLKITIENMSNGIVKIV